MGDYGEAGRPLRRSPFLFGLLFAAGALVAFAGFEGVRKLSTIVAQARRQAWPGRCSSGSPP